MDIEAIEVFAHDSNFAVMKPPGRHYPGCVIQGDSLATLCRMANRITEFARSTEIDDEDVLWDIQELNNALIGRLLHYQDVLRRHNIDFPHVNAFSETDLVQLLPEGEKPAG
ncbi:MAG: hypothetical protein JNM18_12960 [Planctomycetaceae bacterium]|nr:hypothetical protein [Planctomycetaceae bacterium]